MGVGMEKLVVSMSVQTFDRTFDLGQSSACGPHHGLPVPELLPLKGFEFHTRKVHDSRDPRASYDRAHQR